MKHRDPKTGDVYMISDRKGWRKARGQKMTLEMNEEQRAELARLWALDAKQKARVLEKKMGTEPLEKENADLKRQLEERRNLAKKRFYADLLIYCLLEINLFAIMTQQWDVKLLYFFLAEVVGLLVWTGWAFFWESRKS